MYLWNSRFIFLSRYVHKNDLQCLLPVVCPAQTDVSEDISASALSVISMTHNQYY